MKRFKAIHQYHSGTALHDAVTQSMFDIQSRLRGMGYESEIFAQYLDPALANRIHRIDDYTGNSVELLVVHHSMGSESFDRVVYLSNPLVTMYHNITPDEYFDDAAVQRYARIGREQLRMLAQRSRLGIACSNYNRREMLDAGFSRVEVLPPRTDFASFSAIRGQRKPSADWLFVGRVVANKCQLDLVRAFAAYTKTFVSDARLLLVGDLSSAQYVQRVRDEAARLQIDHQVHLLGKVADTQLRAALASAGVFVCLSEHEGFGVPLLEAMAAGVPVVALAAAAVPETMGGAGILLQSKEPSLVAATARAIFEDNGLRQRLVDRQFRRLEQVQNFDVSAVLQRVLTVAARTPMPIEVQIQGPFETSYSLALMNRRLAEALDKVDGLRLSIYATEGPGDYLPDKLSLARVPEAAALHRRSRSVEYPDVVIRQMWPPRIADSPGGITCAYFGWEESLVPEQVARELDLADGIGAMSQFVADALVDSGVTAPIRVVGNGVTCPDPRATIDAPELADLRSFRFLHMSSAFPRKGVDALLEAYFSTFDGSDNTSLVLKTFPNPHNSVGVLLESLRAAHPNPPDVRWIDRDLPDDQVDGLYNLAHCLVHPARGEGFGLPVAEAMLARIPVIATAWSGLAEFVSDDTALTVPYRLEPAQTHLSVSGSQWAEPDRSALSDHMRRIYERPDEPAIEQRVEAAYTLISKQFSWAAAADRWIEFISELRHRAQRPTIGLVSTWNTKCGIAEYSRYLVSHARRYAQFEIFADRAAETLDLADETCVLRTWDDRWHPDLDSLEEAIDRTDPEVIHVQFNFGFFELSHLASLIERQQKRRGVVVTLHRTADMKIDGELVTLADIAGSLAKADKLIVHQSRDASYLRDLGLGENVAVVPQGVPDRVAVDGSRVKSALGLDGRQVIATFGFLLPHKGLLELLPTIDAIRRDHPALLLLALCARHPNSASAEHEAAVRRSIADLHLEHHVMLVTDFLEDEVARASLAAADVIVLPYLATEESSSAALRFVISTGRPLVVTDLPIFADVGSAALTVAPGTAKSMESSIRSVLSDLALQADLAHRAVGAARRFSWSRVAAAHAEIYESARQRVRTR